MTAGEWNAKYPPGWPVIVTLANGKRIRTETASEAVRVGQFDMIKVAAIQPGSVLLSWCWPLKPGQGLKTWPRRLSSISA